MSRKSDLVPETNLWKLVPLTPQYSDDDHGVYVNAIQHALEDKRIQNIALSGNYGVGKSSILQRLAENNPKRVVELSLSTLAPIESSNLDESVPKQATTSTNRIQQEIVKQLLYREEPSKTPESRFQRIDRFNKPRELATTAFLGLIVTLIFLLSGWTEEVAVTLGFMEAWGTWNHLILLILSSGVFFLLRWLFFGRVHVKQFTAGAATVTLDKKSVSFFDQYLDEIVYFFEVSNRNIVIFEDLDRFDDPLIFETLRALNTLLNNAPQIKNTVRFIYAVKDSIFDQNGLLKNGRTISQNHLNTDDPAQAEVLRANRTKFFDLVIPVVPFITHRSAKSLTKRLLDEIEHKIDSDLIDLASRHIPDMRLLKNARNEFVVFRDRIFSGDGENLSLTETELFAMMLYKCTHLMDFEDVYIGRSKLDQLYRISRSLIVENVLETERELRAIQSSLNELHGISRKSEVLTKELKAYINRIARVCGYNDKTRHFMFNGTVIQAHELGEEFWVEFAQESNNSMLIWSNVQGHQLSFDRPHLEAALKSNLTSEYWDRVYRSELQEKKSQHLESLKFLRRADMGELIKRPEFRVQHLGSEQSLDIITREIFTEGLAYQLLRAGYINRNFTLCTSTFHGDRVSTTATNFIIHHIEKNSMDEYFMLEDDDVDAVIRECGRKVLSEPAAYNISILDQLLKTNLHFADTLVESLTKLGTDEQRFLQAYLPNAEELVKFVERFVAKTPTALTYFGVEVELEESQRLKLVDAALAKLSADIRYSVTSELADYLKTHFFELKSLTTTSLNKEVIKRITRVFAEAGVVIPSLATLSKDIRRAFVAESLYVINRENLHIALGEEASLALDDIESQDEAVFNYIIHNLDAYLSAIDGFSETVSSTKSFVRMIEYLIDQSPDHLEQVVRNANASCIVSDLEEVPSKAWEVLASEQRFYASFRNIQNYLVSTGTLDTHLAEILKSEQCIIECEDVDEPDKERLAITVLNAREKIPSSGIRAKLAESLRLEEYLDVNDITAENDEFFSLLIAKDIIEDNSETYTYLKQVNWAAREHVIQVSSNFEKYVSAEILQGDLVAFFRSNKVNSEVKLNVVKEADEYLPASDERERIQLAQFAVAQGVELSVEAIKQISGDKLPPQTILLLLAPHLSDIASDQLFDILKSMGGAYRSLTEVGRDKPKVPNTIESRALLKALKSFGIVNSYNVDRDVIRVNKKYKRDD